MAVLARLPVADEPRILGSRRLAPEVEQGLIRGNGVVALETLLVAHGLPHPDGVETALRSEQRVREVVPRR